MLSVIIPTYNEKENIRHLVEGIFRVFDRNGLDGELLLVDDNSPDGTGRIAEGLRGRFPRLRVIVRKKERGLSSAILRGFEAAKGNVLLVMDADFSHPLELIPKLVAALGKEKCDIAIASRNVGGGGVENWPLKRRIISRGATTLARLVTDVKDPMSGYFAIRRSVIEGVKLNPKGYKIGLELLARGKYRKVVEVPYVFRDRRAGKSKLDSTVMGEYLSHLLGLLFAANSAFRRFAKFCTVGALGMLVNIAVLYALTEKFGFWYLLSATLAFGVAVTFNFVLNRSWTFRSSGIKGAGIALSYAKFVLVSVIGLGLNLVLLYLLVDHFHFWYIFSQVVAILTVAVWNYSGSKLWAFHV